MIRQDVIYTLAEYLRSRSMKLATAESCTGGGVAQALTAYPGSSQWFECGWVSYSNRAKIECLGVSPAVLAREGAVSEQVVQQMVAGACRAAQTDWALAITGIAGPEGGSVLKPVGYVWLGWGNQQQQYSECCRFQGSRDQIREASIDRILTNFVDFLNTSS